MPLALVPGNDYRFGQRMEEAKKAAQVETVRGGAPWMGYVPDLPAELVGLNGAQTVENLMARGDENQQGEILTQPPGFEVIDAGRYTNDTAQDELLAMSANSNRSATGVMWFPRTNNDRLRTGNFDLTIMMVTAGDDSNPGSAQLWRVEPGSGEWQEVPHSALATYSVAMEGDYPLGKTNSDHGTQLCDWVVAPFGADPRTNMSGVITQPSLLWTNFHDPVYIYPGQNGAEEDGDYEDLTNAFGDAAVGFRCRSLELYNDRINFFNTVEDGVNYRQRLRRSPVGNCDPDPANDGTGFIDLEKFSGDGLRVERLGNLLACYLTDGMAVMRATGSYIQPYAQEVVTLERSLVSTHSLCRIGGGRHFGIFNDGWFIVDNSGQFREVGLTDTGGGTAGVKWKYSFYDRINRELVDRIQMEYDTVYQLVYITLPINGQEAERYNREVWIYDILSDRVWPQVYESTYFSSGQVVLQAGATYDDWTGSYDDLDGTYASYGPQFGLRSILHGTQWSTVMAHNPTIIERDNPRVINGVVGTSQPGTLYRSVLSPGNSAREMKTLRELWLEHVQSTATHATLLAYSMEDDSNVSQAIGLNAGVDGKRIIQSAGLHKSGSQLYAEVSTANGQIKVVGLEADVVLRGARRLQGV